MSLQFAYKDSSRDQLIYLVDTSSWTAQNGLTSNTVLRRKLADWSKVLESWRHVVMNSTPHNECWIQLVGEIPQIANFFWYLVYKSLHTASVFLYRCYRWQPKVRQLHEKDHYVRGSPLIFSTSIGMFENPIHAAVWMSDFRQTYRITRD